MEKGHKFPGNHANSMLCNDSLNSVNSVKAIPEKLACAKQLNSGSCTAEVEFEFTT